MNNFLLFALGLAITLISGMGILVYMVSLGYKKNEKREKEIEKKAPARIESALIADLPVVVLPISILSEPKAHANEDPSIEIPSIS